MPPSLPSGGGAIRGIGEKVSTNAANGTATLDIPIPLSPARGLQPELALRYDSGAGNGPFGVGWRMSVPSVTRKTDKQLPTYVDVDDADTFVLAGAEDLVPTGNGTDNVRRYRPRVEAGFARIERHLDETPWWRTTSATNVTSTYGHSAGARIADPADGSRVFAWLLERSEDALGNVVVFEYVAEDLTGVEGAAELHRLDGSAPTANRYLKRIRYGNTVPHDETTCVFEVVFDYGDHDGDSPDPIPGGWPVRADAFSSYRAGFDIRTYRLCRRVLGFHRFPELGEAPCLVRSTVLSYDGDPALAHLVAVEQRGHLRDGDEVQTTVVPALVLRYTQAGADLAVREVARDGAGDLGGGVDGSRDQWVDLDAEGLPGALSDVDGALYYRRNLGGARLGPPRALVTRPSVAALAGGEQYLMDLGGDGRLDLVQLGPPLPGFHERIPAAGGDGDWTTFQPFGALPAIAWSDPSVKFLDLDGDGLEDVLVARDDDFLWYPSLGKDGFGPPRTLPRPRDDERGPAVVFADAGRGIVFADVSGDGLRDLVRVENGRICYWPNLGHGRFGAMITMAGAPVFDAPDQFDVRRVRFADIDGSGTSDLLYAGRDAVRYWLNLAGNAWSAPHDVDLPPDTRGASVTVVDVLGAGTACLVWSSPAPADLALYYVDLVGGSKPHLLAEVDNQLGFVTTVHYAPSTKFYLGDRAAGIHWKTQLPFPVHVVERVETYDAIRRVRFVSELAYRDGYYDGHEREFRGFGFVEQRDTESDAAASGGGLFTDRTPASRGELAQPPVVMRTWFHTGAWLDDGPGERIVTPAGLSTDESRDAYRALRGLPLRQEVYAADGTAAAERPYLVTEHGHEVVCLQPAAAGASGVFFAHPRETIQWHYERELDDPRIKHDLVLSVDACGHVRRSAAIAYPRRTADARAEQRELIATIGEADAANEIDRDDWYRHGVPLESRSYQLHGIVAPAGDALFRHDEVVAMCATAAPIAYDAVIPAGPSKRLVERARTRYYDATAIPAALPFGQIDGAGLVYESYGLAFTAGQATSLFEGRATDAILLEGGYCHLDDPGDLDSVTGWWTATGRSVPDPGRFFLPAAYLDPFGNPPTTLTYDAHALVVTSFVDARGSTTTAVTDYRTLLPRRLTDPNGNQTAVSFDPLGRVTALWVMGNPARDEGDRPPEAPTLLFEYAFYDRANGRPGFVHSAARETHGDPASRWQHSYVYSDGTGRVVMTKAQAEPGPAWQLIDDQCVEFDADPRWVGTGRTVFDNKGNPIKQYEPYFSTAPDWEDEDSLVCQGVTPILHYDPLGRLIRSDRPDGSVTRVEFTPWHEATWDANDTVGDPGNLWLSRAQASPDPAVRRAAELALAHAGTPTVTHFDVLGRGRAVVADNKTETFETRTELDIEGNALAVWDALGRACMTRSFGMLGQACRSTSIDGGPRYSLVDVAGQLLRRWDPIDDQHDRVVRATYDNLHRALDLRVQIGEGTELVAERTVWGEDAPPDPAANRRGRVYQSYDGAGVATSAYDFKGNVARTTRQLCADYASSPDWSASPALESEIFTAASEYDALNRMTRSTAPDGSVALHTFNAAALLERLDVHVRGAADATTIVGAIDYDEKGQRTRIVYGAVEAPTTVTDYTYEPLTSRLAGITTTRTAGPLQALAYTYDPIGNIVQIGDGVQAPSWYDGDVVDGTTTYAYDPVYRLAEARGREHAGIALQPRSDIDVPVAALPHPNDGQALVAYGESYAYDAVGNLRAIAHGPPGAAPAWIAPASYLAGTNRIAATMVEGDDPDQPATWHGRYTHDAFGNMTSMPHLARIDWDWKDRMQRVDKGGGGTVHFTYDAGGTRMRKVWVHGGTVDERIYLGGHEMYRRRKAGALDLERQTLHVTDGVRRVAMIETKTIDASLSALVPSPIIRFQLGNHLGSVALEIDAQGQLISYEEYHPFGTSAYRAFGTVEVSSRRYRYTDRERDDETGLAYHGARYYCPWLARWTAADPAGIAADINLYQYCKSNPITLHDPTGHQGTDAAEGSVLNTIDGTFSRKGIAYNTEVTVRIRLKNGVVVIRRYDRVFVDPTDGRFKPLEAKGADPTHLTRDEMIADKWVQEQGGEMEIIKSAGKPPPGHGAKSEMINFTPGKKIPVEPGDLHYTHGSSSYEGAPGQPNAMKTKMWTEGMEAHPDVVRPPGTVMKTRPNAPPEYITQDDAVAERTRNIGPKKAMAEAPLEEPTTAEPPSSGGKSPGRGVGVVEGEGIIGELGTGVKAVAPAVAMWGFQKLAQRNYDEAAALRDSYEGMPTDDQIARQERAGWKFTGELDEHNKPKWEYAPSGALRARDTILYIFNPFEPVRRSGRPDEFAPPDA